MEHGSTQTRKTSRRNLLTKAAVLVAGGTVGGAEVYANRPGATIYEANDETVNRLAADAEKLVQAGRLHIDSISSYVDTPPYGSQTVQPTLNPNAIAHALLLMGYMEGGGDGSDRMYNFLDQNPLHVKEMPDVFPLSEGRTTSPEVMRLVGLDDTFTLELNPNIFRYDYQGIGGIGQALYLVEEQARDGQVATTALQSAKIGSAFAAFALVRKFVSAGAAPLQQAPESKVGRRAASATIGLGAAAVGFIGAYGYMNLLSPEALQADQQGGDIDHFGDLASREPLRSVLEETITYTTL